MQQDYQLKWPPMMGSQGSCWAYRYLLCFCSHFLVGLRRKSNQNFLQTVLDHLLNKQTRIHTHAMLIEAVNHLESILKEPKNAKEQLIIQEQESIT